MVSGIGGVLGVFFSSHRTTCMWFIEYSMKFAILNTSLEIDNCYLNINKRNNKCFNNCADSLFFLMVIFLKHLWLIPNILKWQDCKIFTRLVPLQIPSRSSHQRCSVKKGVLKILWNITGKYLYWSHFSIKMHAFWPVTLFRRDSNTSLFPVKFVKFFQNICFEEHMRPIASALPRIYKT